jgi:hypothetical protein
MIHFILFEIPGAGANRGKFPRVATLLVCQPLRKLAASRVD